MKIKTINNNKKQPHKYMFGQIDVENKRGKLEKV